MNLARHNVETVVTVDVPDPLPPTIVRPRQHITAVLAQSLAETGPDGRAALAWAWTLTGTRPSPVTLTLASGRPPTREQILAEADADPEGSTAGPGVPTDYCDQIGEARRIMTWLVGGSDDIPVDDDQRGRFIGARDDYARTDLEIRQVRDRAVRSLAAFDLPDPIDPADSTKPWHWPPAWANAAWQRGVRDLLDWVLGDKPNAPLTGRAVGLPTAHDLTYEEATASDIAVQGRSGGPIANPARYPPPHYGEAILAAVAWLQGLVTAAPDGRHHRSPRMKIGAQAIE
jgi:hypothetical protein